MDYNDYAREVDNTVHKTGNETIAGIKTFSQGDIRGRTSTSSSLGVARYACFDKDGKQFSDAWITRSEGGNSNGISWAGFRISDGEGRITAGRSLSIFKLPDSDTVMTDAPTPAASDNSTQIATTAWAVGKIKSFVLDESRKISTNLATNFSDTYTATQDGVLAIDYQASGDGYVDVLKNGVKIGRWGAKTYSEVTIFIPVQPNDIISFGAKIGSVYIVSQYFAPYKGF